MLTSSCRTPISPYVSVLADAVTANYCLADIFGELTEIRSTLNEDLQSKVRVIATIKIQRLVSLS
ncbi:hypothetical protein YC2023_035752 [Brassica napus]